MAATEREFMSERGECVLPSEIEQEREREERERENEHFVKLGLYYLEFGKD